TLSAAATTSLNPMALTITSNTSFTGDISATTISMNVSKPGIADDVAHSDDSAQATSSKDSSQRFTDILRPSPVRTLTAVAMVDVACGRAHTIVIAASGEAYSWGSNEFGQCGIENTSSAVTNSTTTVAISDIDALNSIVAGVDTLVSGSGLYPRRPLLL
ncbi:MAG: hypothetical protein EBV06_16925, partial [Planctomycetia bacterium]|nr:hypothetical protein [Planctomycetia bacterium]